MAKKHKRLCARATETKNPPGVTYQTRTPGVPAETRALATIADQKETISVRRALATIADQKEALSVKRALATIVDQK